MADDEKTVMDLPLDELRARTDEAVEIIRALRELVARHDAEHDGATANDAVGAAEEPSPDLKAYLETRVEHVQSLLPGMVHLVVERRDEIETWRANLAVMRQSLAAQEALAASTRVEVERGALVLRACDVLAEFLDEIHAAVYRSMGVPAAEPGTKGGAGS